jgi:hypothetical protein
MRVFGTSFNLHSLHPYYPIFTNLDRGLVVKLSAVQVIQTQNASNYSIQFHIIAGATRIIIEG